MLNIRGVLDLNGSGGVDAVEEEERIGGDVGRNQRRLVAA